MIKFAYLNHTIEATVLPREPAVGIFHLSCEEILVDGHPVPEGAFEDWEAIVLYETDKRQAAAEAAMYKEMPNEEV